MYLEDWQYFILRPEIKSLPLMEQKRQFLAHQLNYNRMLTEANAIQQQMQAQSAASAGGGKKPGSLLGFQNKFSLNFDGTDDIVQTAAGATSYLNGASQMSLSIWFNLDVAAQNKGLIGDYYTASNIGHFSVVTKQISGDNYSLRFNLNGGDNRFNLTGNPFTINQWHNLVMVFDAGTLNFYIDGASAAFNIYDGSVPSSLSSSSQILQIGRHAAGELYWDGKIDEPAIYLTALTSDQVTTIYNGGVPGDISSLNPVAWYRFEEGSGTTAIDAGSGGNDATISGATFESVTPS